MKLFAENLKRMRKHVFLLFRREQFVIMSRIEGAVIHLFII